MRDSMINTCGMKMRKLLEKKSEVLVQKYGVRNVELEILLFLYHNQYKAFPGNYQPSVMALLLSVNNGAFSFTAPLVRTGSAHPPLIFLTLFFQFPDTEAHCQKCCALQEPQWFLRNKSPEDHG